MVWKNYINNWYTINNNNNSLEVEIFNKTNGGIFSTTTIILKSIMAIFALIEKEPDVLITKTMYFKYNYLENHDNYLKSDNDIYNIFFKINKELKIEDYIIVNLKGENIINDEQFINYKNINYRLQIPFIKKYFEPSDEIKNIIYNIEKNYINKYNYENICVLFYRGNDKNRETNICSYEDIILKAKEIMKLNPNIIFLLQSDELEFIKKLSIEFSNSFYFDENLSKPINKDLLTNNVNILPKFERFEYGKKYIAITQVMSKCKYVVCTSGNCSIWIAYYRGNANNIFQYLNNEWV